MTTRVFLAGEGPTELGGWAHEPEYRQPAATVVRRGVIVALLARAWGGELTVVDAVLWKRIRKYRAGDHAAADERNVLGAAEHAVTSARRSGAPLVLAFSRDRDRNRERERQVESGIVRARVLWPTLTLVGGCAVEEIEAWGLAVAGDQRPESVSDAKRVLAERIGVGLDPFVERIDSATAVEMRRACERSPSLGQWMDRAEAGRVDATAEP